MNEARIDFVSEVVSELLETKVGINLPQTKRIHYSSIDCNGFFDNTPELTFQCAVGKPEEEWFPIFIHEYCHYRQWKEKEPCYFKMKEVDAEGRLDRWIGGEEHLMDFVYRYADLTKANEYNCEERVVVILEAHPELDIDKIKYIKQANSYVWFYDIIPQVRQWYGTAPYEVEEIYSKLPENLLRCCNVDEYPNLVKEHCLI